MNPTKKPRLSPMQPSVFEILNDPELYSQHCHSLRETLLDHFNHQATLIDTYEHELEKSKNANKAFQQALSEIGTVVISVAMGDLSKKVEIHTVENDPEILKVKITINTMMDQLQTFANQPSARNC